MIKKIKFLNYFIILITISVLFFILDKYKFFGNLTYLDLLKFLSAILFLMLSLAIIFKFNKFLFINIKYFLSLNTIIFAIIIFFIFQFLRMNFINCEMLSEEQQCVCYDLHYNYFSTDFYKEKYVESCKVFRQIDEFEN